MKTFSKTLPLFISTLLFAVSSSFSSVTAQNFTQGIYKTSEDYTNHHLTLYDEISWVNMATRNLKREKSIGLL